MPDEGKKFDELQPLYERLTHLVYAAVDSNLQRTGLKVHSLTCRVKSKESFLGKLERKTYKTPFDQIEDIAGIRIVCLFLSDVDAVVGLVQSLFDVTTEDKVASAAHDQFGYMSIHCIGTLGSQHNENQYYELGGLKFEIQVRTMLMDAWANVSHHLDYKGEASIPTGLRRDFHALSGLFYIADQHFELFVRQSQKAEREESAVMRTGERGTAEVNLYTVKELLRVLFPGKKESPADAISRFVEELDEAGYATVAALESAIKRGRKDAERTDARRTSFGRLTSLGMSRIALQNVDPKYREVNNAHASRRRGGRHPGHR